MANPTPASASMPYLSQITPTEQGYYGPYMQQGQAANKMLTGQYGNLVNDPMGFYNNLMSGYQQSPYATYQEQLISSQMNNSAAAGGYAGTPYNQSQVGTATQEIASKDMNQWLNGVLGLYKTGLGGEQFLSGQGYGATKSMADIAGQALNEQAGAAFADQAEKNQQDAAHKRFLASLFGGGAGLVGSILEAGNPFHHSSGSSLGGEIAGGIGTAAMFM